MGGCWRMTPGGGGGGVGRGGGVFGGGFVSATRPEQVARNKVVIR